MQTSRRRFIRALGAGAAIGAAVPTLPAQVRTAWKDRQIRLKLIVRADDVGYTNVCNIGAFEAMERGVVTSADVMLDTPGAEDAFRRLKAMPWISVGWHAHFWGSPVLDPKKVPSMVMDDGGRIRFRKDLSSAQDVVYEEALAECRAQLDRCARILGKPPDTGGMGRGNSPFAKAISRCCQDYRIETNVSSSQRGGANAPVPPTPAPGANPSGPKIFGLDVMGATADSRVDSVKQLEQYDPVKFYLEGKANLENYEEGSTVMAVFHPGYVDYYVYRLGDYGAQAWTTILTRVKDVEALCSARFRNWIKENRLELVNTRDALHGTREYQQHLKAIGSDLAV